MRSKFRIKERTKPTDIKRRITTMKKTAMLLLSLALVLCPLFALAQETISVYNWGDYI